MSKVYLFDWGNTLMVDFPVQKGKMYLWPHVEAVEGAEETLKYLSQSSAIYIATSAQDSSESEIQQAFQRVGLDTYISGYFCKANLGLEKQDPEFYRAIINSVGQPASDVTMVGDSLEKDIYPAKAAGLNTVLLHNQNTALPEATLRIEYLRELIK
ncbi:HAD family hydrolase [Vibrio ouci]|uniref:HAD family hydrolase n=1 Tax=Vibrio ouci TaxID=2499078 RepID=A0A4Y8WDY4_9VIBR|nr:HAD family hydrolase [Vibrio ouci]TFH90578.1 HAD family hydrolase [Vibrio ouci]